MEKMKTMTKYAIFAVIVLFVLYQYRGIQRLERLNQLQAVEISHHKDTVAQFRTKTGELYFKLEATEVEKRNLKKALEIAGHDNKKLKEQGIRLRKLISALQFELESVDTGQTVIKDTLLVSETDTVKAGKFTVDNGYLLFNGLIKGDSLDWNSRYNIDLDVFQEKERNKTIITLAVSDTTAVIRTGSSIVVEHKKRFYERPVVWGVVAFIAGMFVK